MRIEVFAVFLAISLILSTIIHAQPDVVGRCVTFSEARAGGIRGTDCELFAMGFCSDTKSEEEQYWECQGGGSDTKDDTKKPADDTITDNTVVYPPGMYYNNYEIALYEYETIWNNGNEKESDPRMAQILQDYFDAGGCSDYASTNPNSVTDWSAAFISYVMTQTGMDFPGSCAHIAYFRDIKSNPGACKTYPMTDKNQIDVGDIICRCRPASGQSSCSIDYDNLPKGDSPAHCDIVTSRNGDDIEITGGNTVAPGSTTGKGETANNRASKISKLGSDYFGFISCAGMGKPYSVEEPPIDVPEPKIPDTEGCPLVITFITIPFLFILKKAKL